jgi:UDP-N-acetylmuramate dehydrogenase
MPTPLAPLTTLRLGGPAEVLVECTTSEQLIHAALAGGFVLAGGSNVVLPDDGLDRVVLVRTRGIEGLTVQAGEDWDGFVAWSVEQGYSGLEALSGIPGTVGAAPIQNIGAYGAEVASFVDSVRVLDLRSGAVVTMYTSECHFGYRRSRFKGNHDFVVLSVTFDLLRGELSEPVRYAELAATLGVSLGDRAPCGEVRTAVLKLRRSKGMVVDPADPDSVSAGSFFTNPVVSVAPPGAPSWPDASGGVKVSAAWLIENSGFDRGWGTGQIGLSSKHTLAVVNRGGGTTAELLAVAREIRAGVVDRFGITLVNEPVIVGDSL